MIQRTQNNSSRSVRAGTAQSSEKCSESFPAHSRLSPEEWGIASEVSNPDDPNTSCIVYLSVGTLMLVEPIFTSNSKATRNRRPSDEAEKPQSDEDPKTSATEDVEEHEERGERLWSGAGSPDRQFSDASHDSDDSTFPLATESFKNMLEGARKLAGAAEGEEIRLSFHG